MPNLPPSTLFQNNNPLAGYGEDDPGGLGALDDMGSINPQWNRYFRVLQGLGMSLDKNSGLGIATTPGQKKRETPMLAGLTGGR